MKERRRSEENVPHNPPACLAIPSSPANLKRIALMELVWIHVSLLIAGFERGERGVVRGQTIDISERTQVRRTTGAEEGHLLTSRPSADLNGMIDTWVRGLKRARFHLPAAVKPPGSIVPNTQVDRTRKVACPNAKLGDLRVAPKIAQ